jgi:PTS system nitrogen regulatory IIA component
MERILTVKDVAQKLQLSKSTVYKYTESKKIPSIKIGKQWRFTEDDLAQYLLLCKESTNKGVKK